MGQKYSVEELVSFLIGYRMSDLTFSSQFDFLASGHRLHNMYIVQYDSPVSKILGVFFWNLDSVLL